MPTAARTSVIAEDLLREGEAGPENFVFPHLAAQVFQQHGSNIQADVDTVLMKRAA